MSLVDACSLSPRRGTASALGALLAVCLSCPAAWAEDPGQAEVAPAPPLVPPPPDAPPPAPPEPAAPPAPAAPKLGDPGVVKVHIDSPVPVTLVHEHEASYPVMESWVDRFGNTVSRPAVSTRTADDPLCSSPCDGAIGDRNLRIMGRGFPPSSKFDFAEMTGDVTLHVRPGNYGVYSGGIAAIIVGSFATLAGAILIPVNQAASTTTDRNTGFIAHVPDPALRAAGIGLIAGGVVAIGGGIALFLAGRTTVSFDAQAGARRALVRPRYWMGEF